jgi:hypothetical protein
MSIGENFKTSCRFVRIFTHICALLQPGVICALLQPGVICALLQPGVICALLQPGVILV